MHGEPALKPGFTHFPYANPKAPKGGALVLADQGSFDSLNPLIIKGAFPAGLRDFVYESLMARSFDEPFTLYGLIASSIDTPDDRSEATFRLDPKARFSDGHPVTAADVVFSWQTLRDKGRPNHRTYYAKVEKVETPDPLTVRFIFKNANDRELPLILGLMPILPKHVFETREFEKASLDIPIGSGPYTVGKVDPGAGITYRRNPDYWGRDLPVNRGRYNFDTVRYEYFRDANSMFEAFKKGLYDLREETNSGRWASSYDFPALKAGKVKKSIVPVGTPAGFAAFAFNTRREIFADIRVRKALSLMFDFTWVNKHLFHGLFKRTQSVFDRSSLSSHGVKASEYERKLLAPFPDAVLPGIMDGTFSLPRHDGSGRDRKQQRAAIKLLRGAGYKLQNGVMVGGASGKALEFEILCATRAQERLALNFSGSLKRIGVTARVRLVDSAQYQRRRQTFDFDLVQTLWLSSLSPGNEQAFRWGSAAAGQEGSFNYAGVKSPAADAMIKAMLAATSRKDFTDAVRALDRVLLSGYYTIPLYHQSGQWLAWWKKITGPDVIPLYGNRTDLWWYRGDEPG
ncbi:MAG: ABC transporter substrate-binding protein [Hyphomicrobiales bacterium]|nr:MAG: ABC transporter substrate-binding protein [Hyphomicrobiales bacterium]